MESIKDNENRRNENLHSLTELEVAGNILITIRESDGYLLMKRGDTYTSYVMITRKGINYWKPTNAFVR